MYLNKNTILSNYNIEEIKIRTRMLGHELRALIFNNYERYGIDNDYKENNYSIMVITILAMVESAYRRALNGEASRDVNQSRIVQQTDSPQNPYPIMQTFNMPNQNQKKWWNPLTWAK